MSNPYEPRKNWANEYDAFTSDDLQKLKEGKIPSSDCFANFLDYLAINNRTFKEFHQSTLAHNPLVMSNILLRAITAIIVWWSFYGHRVKCRLRLMKDGYLHPKQIYFQYRYTTELYHNHPQ